MRSPLILPALIALMSAPILAWGADSPAFASAMRAQVVGVVGAGEQIGLQLKEGEASRTLKLGEAYQDGWVLTKLSPSAAILTRNGQDFELALNPEGRVLAAAETAPSKITVIGGADAAVLQRLIEQGRWDGQPRPGLTLEETQRNLIYNDRTAKFVEAERARLSDRFTISIDALKTAAGGPEAFADLQAILAKGSAAMRATGPGPGQAVVTRAYVVPPTAAP